MTESCLFFFFSPQTINNPAFSPLSFLRLQQNPVSCEAAAVLQATVSPSYNQAAGNKDCCILRLKNKALSDFLCSQILFGQIEVAKGLGCGLAIDLLAGSSPGKPEERLHLPLRKPL